MTETTAQSSEVLYPEDFFDSIESSVAELTIRMQTESDLWSGRTELGATFHRIDALLAEAISLVPKAKKTSTRRRAGS